MRSVFPPRSYNMYLLLTTPVALFLLIYGSHDTCCTVSSDLRHLQVAQTPVRTRKRVLERTEDIRTPCLSQTLWMAESRSGSDHPRRNHVDSSFSGLRTGSDLAGFFQSQIPLGRMRSRVFHPRSMRLSRIDPADPAHRHIQHRQSRVVFSARRNNHRHTAYRNLSVTLMFHTCKRND